MSGLDTQERATVSKHDLPAGRHRDDPVALILSEGARHGLDGQAEIIGNVLARHRQLHQPGLAARQSLQEYGQFLRGIAAPEQMRMGAGALQRLQGIGLKLARRGFIIGGRLLQRQRQSAFDLSMDV